MRFSSIRLSTNSQNHFFFSPLFQHPFLLFCSFFLFLSGATEKPAHAAAVGNEAHNFGAACSSDKANGADWDTLFQCKNGTWQRAPYYFGASTDTCDASHAGVVQWTGTALQYCNGTAWTAMGGAAAGSTGQVQYNNGGVLAGASSLIYTGTGSIGIGTTSPSNQLGINGSQGILNLGANGWVDPGATGSSIVTDNNSYKALMIIGNNVSGNSGKGREVKVWDYLNVQGALNTTGGATFAGSVGVGVAPSQALTVSGNVLATGVLYPSNQTSYYLYGETGNSGLRTNGNFLASGNIYWGSGANWLSAYLNQAVLTTSAPTFANLYVSSNLYLGYLGDWISNRLNQAVTTGAQPNFWNIYVGYLGWLSDILNQAVRTDSSPTFNNIYLNGQTVMGWESGGALVASSIGKNVYFNYTICSSGKRPLSVNCHTVDGATCWVGYYSNETIQIKCGGSLETFPAPVYCDWICARVQ